jgi:hypothetical protein
VITIDELQIADAPEAWKQAGFAVVDRTIQVGTVRVRLVGPEAGAGIVGWTLRGVPAEVTEVHGLPTSTSTSSQAEPAEPGEHASGATQVDHVVVMSPDLARTTAAIEALGAEVRRVRDFDIAGTPMRQVFFRLGEVIVELVGDPASAGDGPASFWGITFTVADIDAAAALLGDRTGRVKDAVQRGRRITTLRHRDLGLSVSIALMSPKPPRP